MRKSPVDQARLSVLPVFFLVVLCPCFALLQPLPLIFFGDLVPDEDFCADQSGFEISCRKVVWRPAESLETNNAINAHTIDEGEHAWEDLDAQLGDQEGAVVDVDFQNASFVMSLRERLSKSDCV
jgi:hypothetical protein